jgi:hypothetical protein
MNFVGFEWMPPVLDNAAKRAIFYTSRQVGKTTCIALRGLVKCAACPPYSRLYVGPTQNHCGAYSKQKLADLILTSPYYRQTFFGKGKTNQAYYKGMTNGSEYWLRWFATGVNSVRGLSVDGIDIDEVQLIQSEDIPVILESMARSSYKDLTYAGTPLHSQNPIQDLWDNSTKTEWLVKCTHCNRHNYLDERNIHPEYLCCRYCGKQIYPENGQWVSFDRSKSSKMLGVRVSALMIGTLPWTEEAGGEDSVIWKYNHYPTAQFRNEVMALPSGDAGKPITESELIDCCDPELAMCKSINDKEYLKRMQFFGGVDWASDLDSGKSYNVHCIGGFLPDRRFLVVHAKRYMGREADKDFLLQNIVKTQLDFKAPFIGADHGMGADKCYDLAKMLAPRHGGVTAFSHQATQKAPILLHPTGKLFQVNRTLVLSTIFHLLKQGRILFFRYEDAKTFLEDILNVYCFFNSQTRFMQYDHPEKKPDDFLHALTFCYLAATMNLKLKLFGNPG